MSTLFGEMRDAQSPWIKKPSADVLTRQSRRGTTQLEERQEHDGEERFIVAGSDGDEYVVAIGGETKARLSCTCPDKVVPCKHIWFIYLDVLLLAKTDPLTWQTSLTPKEVYKLIPRLDPSKKRTASTDADSEELPSNKKAKPDVIHTRSYDDKVDAALDVMHSIDHLKPSKQFGHSNEVSDEISAIVDSILSDATTNSTDTIRTNAILSLLTVVLEILETPHEVCQALTGCGGGPAGEILQSIGTILDDCEGTLEEAVLKKVERTVKELGLYDIENEEIIEKIGANRAKGEPGAEAAAEGS